jgi:hypothetical protein
MTINEWLIIIAIIIAPVVAIQIDKYIERKKEKKERKMNIFRTLMTTRASVLSVQHVEALNMIDIEFFDCKKITDSWKVMLDNFENYPQDTKAADYQARLSVCTEKHSDLLVDLLYEMSRELKYKFDKVHLKRGIYLPKGHADFQQDQDFIRHSLIGVLLGKVPIPIKIITEEDNQQNTK